MPTTRAMEAQFQTLLEKLTEMKSDLTSMNANMGEMKSELTASMNANMDELNNKLTAKKEELKSDLKGIGDKLTTMDKKFEEMEGRIESVENKFENKFVDIENKFENKFEDMESKLEKLKQKVMTGQGDEFKFQAPYSKPSIKLSTYDGKSSWQVYKTQFSIVADANQWDSQTKACQLAASLRADAADILQTLPETQRLDFDALVNALELRFGEKCVKDYSRLQLKSQQQKVSETLQELATDVERLSHLAFSDCPTEVREVLALQHFIDGVRDPEIQKALRMADLKDLKGALVFAMKFEAAQQATRKDRHPIRAVNESDTSNSSVERLERQMRSFMNRVESLMSQKADGKKTLKCWTCGREGHLQRSCRARQGAETNSASQKGGVGKLINGHLVGRRLPDFGKPHFQVCQISTKSTDRDGEKIDVHGKLKVKIKFGDTTYQHAVYVADIADPFILGLDFLKEHGFTLDFNKNELRSIHEEVTIFKIEHRTESIRQVTANENITTPRTEIIVPGYIGNDVSFNSGLIGTAENKANGLLIASTLVDLSRKLSRNSSDIGHTTVTQHRIDTADHPPIKQHPRRLPFAKQEEVGTLLREMQENDIIEPSSSPWASPIVLVRKKDGSTRFCVDYRKLNDVTKKDSYPLPRIDDTLDTLSGHKWFSTLDLKSGYWQVEIHPQGPLQWSPTLGAIKVSDKVPYRFVTTSSPILIYPQPDKPFILDTDASNESVGAVLSQEINGQERVVAYWSKCLSKPERNYCVTQKELLAIVKAIEHFHHYLYGQKFLLRTDHASLTWLMNFRNTEGQVARWIQRLNEYYFDIRHRKGSSHGNADALSRRPCPENCRHCSRVETKYDYAIRQITTSTATPPDPWSDEKVREDQMADPDIKPLIEFMESSSNKPSWQDISAYSPTTKQYWALWNSLHLRNGVLYRKFESEDGKTFRWQLVLPRSRIPEVLKELHGSPTGGHFGVMKTLHRVRERFCWGKVRANVEQWCKSCDACSARKGPKIRSRGSCIATMLEHPSNVSLSISWDLCQGLRLRTAARRSRDYRIFTIPDAFGRDLRLPCDLLFGRPPDTPSSPEEYVQNLQARFEDVHNLARERINLRTEKMKTRYDTKATGHQFKEGDKVWFYNPTRRKGLSPKLQSHWDGPYTILKIINDAVIRIRKSTIRSLESFITTGLLHIMAIILSVSIIV
ncbi:hypothetical protein TNCV_3796601 [Trichonephila clavipes]|nr:hypothetical protein TNCV_3796601 [Trichonephila clavipes]